MLGNPFLFPEGFAALGDKNAIPDTPGAPGVANLDTGFPVECGEDEALGGIPPDRLDMNGILFYDTDNARFLAQGGAYQFDATYAGVIGGYPVGAILALPDGDGLVQSIVAANTHDPAVPANLNTYWRPFGGQIAGAAQFARDSSGAANAVVVAIVTGGGGAAYVDGQPVRFQAAHATTGACTLDAGAGPKPLVRNDGVALVANDLLASSFYECVFSHADDKFFLLQPTLAQTYVQGAAAAQPLGNGSGLTSPLANRVVGVITGFTPVRSGKAILNASEGFSAITGAAIPNMSLYYGTGAAPGVGSPSGGTLVPNSGAGIITGATGAEVSMTSNAILTGLAIGTTYWIAVVIASTGAGTFAYNGFAEATAVEL